MCAQDGGAASEDIRVIESTGLSRDVLAEVMAGHDGALATGEGVLKRGSRTHVTCVRVGGQSLVVKEYRPGGMSDRVKDMLRGTRAALAWRAAQHLAACGIATPEPVAVLERGGSHYVVTRLIEGAVPLDRLLCERFTGPLPRSEVAAKRRMLRRLGQWLRRIHDQGIYHNDWSAKNILTVERDGQWAFWLVDLESVTSYKGLTRRRRMKNLSQLNDAPTGVTATDRMRLLRAYAGDDASLTRGRFPRSIMGVTRRRSEARTARLRAAGKPVDDPRAPRGPLSE